MNRLLTTVVLAAVGLAVPANVGAARATWVDDHCDLHNEPASAEPRSDARVYGERAVGEGYEWAGGCWNNNNRDDTPTVPVDGEGEGPDCSGLVFKTWELENSLHVAGWQWWDRKANVHGPYSSYTFYAPVADDPFRKLSDKQNRQATAFMDAFVKQGHIGLLDTSANPTSKTDWILEAYTNESGVEINERGYRYDSAYIAIAREGWTPEPCEPYCSQAGQVIVEVT